MDDDGEREGPADREAQELEFGSRNTVRKHDLCQPCEQERIEHEMTHRPFRSWCGHRIKGRGRAEDCRKETEEERRVPEVHLDYTFMGDEKEGKTVAFFVARETETKVWCRGPTGECICRRLMA